MTKELKPIDVSRLPDVLRIAEEVRDSREPRLLKRDGEDLAVIVPAGKVRTRRGKTRADYEAFRSAAGGWKDVDTDKLIADIYADRRISNRPPVVL